MAGSGLMGAPFLAISEDHLRPRPCAGTESHDRFRNRLENRLDRRHARVRLAGILNGSRCDETFGVRYGPDRGSPGQPTRGMIGRESLQPVYPLSDEAVVAGWGENPYGQSFCGEDYCPPPCADRPEPPDAVSPAHRDGRGRVGPASDDRCRSYERHREAAGVAAGDGRYDRAGPGGNLPDRRPAVKPFPGATGETVPAV